MKFKMIHENYNVQDLDQSLRFYAEALGLHELRRMEAEDGSYSIVYIGNEETDFELELTWLRVMWGPMTWEMKSSIWPSAPMTLRPPIRNTGRWAVSAWKTPRWAFTLSKTRTDIGWKSCRRKNKKRIFSLFSPAQKERGIPHKK